ADLVGICEAVHGVARPHHLSDRLRGDPRAGHAGTPELDARVTRDRRLEVLIRHQALSLSSRTGMVCATSVRSDHRYTRRKSCSITTARTLSGSSPSASSAVRVRLRVTATGSTPAGSRST